LKDHPNLEVVFCCFSSADKAIYDWILEEKSKSEPTAEEEIKPEGEIGDNLSDASKLVRVCEKLN